MAYRLASEGAVIAALDIDEQAGELAAQLPPVPGAKHAAIAVDVTDQASVAHGISAIASQFGRIDVLANVAGGARAEPSFLDVDDQVWEWSLQLNLLGAVRMCRAAAPLLAASESAAVVNVASVNGILPLASEAYSSAKAGLIALTANLVSVFAPDIRINAVAPGTIRTRVWEHLGDPDRLASKYPLERIGEPEDVAAAVAFLASAEASWITGQTLVVDGGLSARRVDLF